MMALGASFDPRIRPDWVQQDFREKSPPLTMPRIHSAGGIYKMDKPRSQDSLEGALGGLEELDPPRHFTTGMGRRLPRMTATHQLDGIRRPVPQRPTAVGEGQGQVPPGLQTCSRGQEGTSREKEVGCKVPELPQSWMKRGGHLRTFKTPERLASGQSLEHGPLPPQRTASPPSSQPPPKTLTFRRRSTSQAATLSQAVPSPSHAPSLSQQATGGLSERFHRDPVLCTMQGPRASTGRNLFKGLRRYPMLSEAIPSQPNLEEEETSFHSAQKAKEEEGRCFPLTSREALSELTVEFAEVAAQRAAMATLGNQIRAVGDSEDSDTEDDDESSYPLVSMTDYQHLLEHFEGNDFDLPEVCWQEQGHESPLDNTNQLLELSKRRRSSTAPLMAHLEESMQNFLQTLKSPSP